MWKERNERVLKGKDVSWEGLLPSVGLRIANWASVSKEFPDFEIDKIMYNWGACLFFGKSKEEDEYVLVLPTKGFY